MEKQVSKAHLSLFIVLSLLANHSVSAKPSNKSYAPAASESENKPISPESLPILPDPDSPITEAGAVDETLSPTYFSVPPSASIPEVETTSDETLSRENVSTLSNADEPSDLQITNGEESLIQELAFPPSGNIDPTLETIGDENINTSPSPSSADNSVLDIRDTEILSQENTSVPPSMADPPAVETENTSLPPSNVDNTDLDIREMDNFSQENTSDPPAVETKESTEDFFQENTSLPPSNVDNTDLDIREMDNFSQKNTSDPPAVETKGRSEDFFQGNTSLPPPPSLDAPALETSDDGSESFSQDNQFPATDVNAPAPETKADQQEITTEDYSSGTLPNPESQNPENVPELNDYSSLPKAANPAPSEAFSFPESDPTIQMTPSEENTFGLAPPSEHTILPSNYRAEDEPVEPYEDEEDSWNGGNGAVAGVLVGACVIGVGGFVYQKRKKDNIRAQYQSLAKKGGV